MLHTINGFLAAAVGFSMVMLLNDDDRITFHLSPAFLALVVFCFSMTIGVLWEFFEFFMDTFLHTDMQKDTIIHTIHSVTLDPTLSNQVVTIHGYPGCGGQRQQPGAGRIPGYWHHRHHEGPDGEFPGGPGLLRHRLLLCPKQGRRKSAAQGFVPSKKTADRDYLQQARQVSTPRKNRRRTPDPHPFRPAQPPAARGASLPEPAGEKFSLKDRPSLLQPAGG